MSRSCRSVPAKGFVQRIPRKASALSAPALPRQDVCRSAGRLGLNGRHVGKAQFLSPLLLPNGHRETGIRMGSAIPSILQTGTPGPARCSRAAPMCQRSGRGFRALEICSGPWIRSGVFCRGHEAGEQRGFPGAWASGAGWAPRWLRCSSSLVGRKSRQGHCYS